MLADEDSSEFLNDSSSGSNTGIEKESDPMLIYRIQSKFQPLKM